MEAFITTVSFDVELSDAERATLYRILSGNHVPLSIQRIATLHVRVRVEGKKEKGKSARLPAAGATPATPKSKRTD